MHKFLPISALCICLAWAAPAQSRTGPEIAAAFNAGLTAYDAGDYDKAFKTWWALQYEDIAAMRNVAMMLRKGQGTGKDPKRAEEFFQRAADAGLATAQADLADMLLKGEAGPPDLESALPLLVSAAAANHPVAQFELGQLYETGAPPNLPQDLATARKLYAAAASHGMKEAGARLAFLSQPAAAPATAAAAPKAAAQPAVPALAAAPPSPAP